MKVETSEKHLVVITYTNNSCGSKAFVCVCRVCVCAV